MEQGREVSVTLSSELDGSMQGNGAQEIDDDGQLWAVRSDVEKEQF